ncbi:hypothetical protein IGJ92_002935 [Enterococcus sp. AZ127]
MKYSIAKRLYELFGFERLNFEKFCWYLYKNGVITLKDGCQEIVHSFYH